jgi:hypothetical protein
MVSNVLNRRVLNVLNRRVLIYASMIAFPSELQTVLLEILYLVYPSHYILHVTIVGFIFIIVYCFVQAVSMVLGVETLKSEGLLKK